MCRFRPMSFSSRCFAVGILILSSSFMPASAQETPAQGVSSLSVSGSDGTPFELSFSCGVYQIPIRGGTTIRVADLAIGIGAKGAGLGSTETPEHTTIAGSLSGLPENLPPYTTWIEVGLDDNSATWVPFRHEAANLKAVQIEFPEERPSVFMRRFWKQLVGADNGTMRDAVSDMAQQLMPPDLAVLDAQTVLLGSLLGANRMRLRVPLDNGDSSSVDVPIGPSLKTLLSGCATAGGNVVGSDSPGNPKDPMVEIMSRPMTADELTSRLPSILSQAAVKYNHDPHVYDDEIPFISRAVRTCAQITPAAAASVRTNYARNFNFEDIDKLGSQYKICHGNGMYVPHPDGRKEAGLWLTIFVSGDSDSIGVQASRHWRDGKGFFVNLHESGRSDTFFEGLIQQGSPSESGGAPSGIGTASAVANQTPAPIPVSANNSVRRNDSQGGSTSQEVKQEVRSTAPALPCGSLADAKHAAEHQKPAAMADIKDQADKLWKANQFTAAVPLYDKACSAGNLGACVQLGWAYFYGNGIQPNDVHGMDLWTKACDAGYGEGCGTLGNVDDTAGGLSGPAQAAPLQAKGCRLGDGGSCYALAGQYRDGRGVVQNLDRAQQLFCKACALGVPSACSSDILAKHVHFLPGTRVNPSPE